MASTVGGRIHGSGRYQGPQPQQPPGDAQRRLPEFALRHIYGGGHLRYQVAQPALAVAAGNQMHGVGVQGPLELQAMRQGQQRLLGRVAPVLGRPWSSPGGGAPSGAGPGHSARAHIQRRLDWLTHREVGQGHRCLVDTSNMVGRESQGVSGGGVLGESASRPAESNGQQTAILCNG